MTNFKTLSKALLCATAMTALSAGSAFAAGTAADTTVSNTFTLDYKVDGTDQPQIDTSAAGSDTPTTFKVDRVINLTVAANDATVNVTAGEQDAQLVYSVTNTGNDEQSYLLTLFDETGVVAGDDFNSTGRTVQYYIGNATDPFDPAATLTTYTSATATDTVPADGRLWVVVTGDIPTLGTGANVADGEADSITLLADTLEPVANGDAASPVTADTGGNDMSATENVLADSDGGAREGASNTATGDGAGEGDHSAVSTFVVTTADVEAVKTVTIINEDGTGCGDFNTTATAGAYSIPGACVEYKITVSNSGSAQADEILAVDILPGELTFVAAQDAGFIDPDADKVLTTGASTDCDGTATTCEIKLDKAELAGGSVATPTVGVLTIRALLK